jgi:hypothetical protein
MRKQRKPAVFFLITAMLVPAARGVAQSMDPAKVEWIDDSLPNQMEPFPQSAASAAGNRNYVTNVDNYMDVHFVNFAGQVEADKFDKWFGFAGLQKEKAALGYGRFLGNFFLGTYFNGNILKAGTLDRSAPDPRDGSTEINTTAPVVLPGGSILSTQIYDSYVNPLVQTDNRLDMLFLIKNLGMALKLGFVENLEKADKAVNTMETFKASDGGMTLVAVKGEPEYSSIKGDIIPSLEWGWILPVGGYYLLPRVEASVNFFQDSEDAVYRDYTMAMGMKISPYDLEQLAAQYGRPLPPSASAILVDPETRYSGRAGNAVTPVFGLGLELMSIDDNTVQAVGLKYNTGFTGYSNDYDVNGISGSVMGAAAWSASIGTTQTTPTDKTTTRKTTLSITEKSASRHTITPIYRWQTQLTDRVSVAYNANIAFDIRSSTSDTKTTKTEIVDVNGTETKTLTTNVYYNADPATADPLEKRDTRIEVNALSVTPALNLGTSYTVIPARLTFTAGLKLKPPSYVASSTRVYTNNTTDINGAKKTANDDGNDITGVVAADGTDVSNQISVVSETEINSVVWTPFDAELSAGFTLYFSPSFALDAALSAVEVGPSGNKKPDLSNLSVIFTLKK